MSAEARIPGRAAEGPRPRTTFGPGQIEGRAFQVLNRLDLTFPESPETDGERARKAKALDTAREVELDLEEMHAVYAHNGIVRRALQRWPTMLKLTEDAERRVRELVRPVWAPPDGWAMGSELWVFGMLGEDFSGPHLGRVIGLEGRQPFVRVEVPSISRLGLWLESRDVTGPLDLLGPPRVGRAVRPTEIGDVVVWSEWAGARTPKHPPGR